MKTLYFIRHGLSEGNKTSRWSGAATDHPLAPEGHEQAKKAAKAAKDRGLSFDVIVSSPLQRAHQTAKYIADHVDYPPEKIIINDLFKERHYGELENTQNLIAAAKYMVDESGIDSFKDVETLLEMQNRADKALKFLESLPHDTVLVVAHGAFGRALRRAALKEPITVRGTGYKNAELVRLI